MTCHECHQNLFNAEVKQLKTKLKNYELEEEKAHRRLGELQAETQTLQSKLNLVENSRAQAETTLKEETAARSQLVSQLFALRKVALPVLRCIRRVRSPQA